ncbi:MAG: hypothetical protein V4665_01300 [Patescibacteria group bacterium]
MKTKTIVGIIILILVAVALYGAFAMPKPVRLEVVDYGNKENAVIDNSISDPFPQQTEIPNSLPAPSSEIRLTGIITEVDHSCYFDGICKVEIDYKTWVVYEKGKMINPEPKGTIEGELTIGTKVEVYAGKDTVLGGYTIFGSKNYYIKVIK